MARFNRSPYDRIYHDIAAPPGRHRELAKDNIPGAISVSAPDQTVTNPGGAAYWSVATQASTTTNAAISAGDGAFTATSVASISVGDVVMVGAVTSTAGTPPAGEVQWVTAVDTVTKIVSVMPGFDAGHANHATVSVIPAIVRDCMTAQDADGTDLGTSVVATGSASVQWATQQVGARLYVAAIRTGLQIAGLNSLPLPGWTGAGIGNQISSLVRANNGAPSGGWSSGMLSSQQGGAVLALEGATPAVDLDSTGSAAAGAYAIGTPLAAGAPFATELLVGDQDEPPELVFGLLDTVPEFISAGAAFQYAHRSGCAIQSPTSSGVSSWTFFLLCYLTNAATTVTFFNPSLTIDPR